MFDFTSKLDLSYLGQDWKDCYLEFRMPTMKELEDIEATAGDSNKTINELKKFYVGGKAIKNKEVVEVHKDDFDKLPLAILTKCINVLSGTIDPK